MKRDTIDDACHGKLCNSSLKETAGEILFAENSGLLQEAVGLVGIGKVGTRHNHIAHMLGKKTENGSRSCATRHICLELD